MYKGDTLKRFAKDHGLPIQVLNSELFYYFLDLYADDLDARKKFSLLEEGVRDLGSEDAFLSYCNAMRTKIIDTLKESDSYKAFGVEDQSKYAIEHKGYPTKDIYRPENDGKAFMSIDLVKANFQAMRYSNPEIVMCANTYKELLSRFTDMAYLHQSKRLRQVIFGNLNPKRQSRIQRYMIEEILEMLLRNNLLSADAIRTVSADEIVFEPSHDLSEDAIVALVNGETGFDVSVKKYRLERIGNKPYYIRRGLDGLQFELACVPNIFYAQALKYAKGLPVEPNDLFFVHEGQLARFVAPLDFTREEQEEENDAE